jgi:hypothetical protein
MQVVTGTSRSRTLLRSVTSLLERFADQLPQCLEERCEIVVLVPVGACEGQHLVRRRRGGQRDP